MISRRQFVYGSVASLASCRSVGVAMRPEEASLFGVGIASGDPTSESVILWTRIIPKLGFPPHDASAIQVDWVLASDKSLSSVVGSGSAIAAAETGYSVHVNATGLDPERYYYYRFSSGDIESEIGRTRTLPAPGTTLDRFRIALTSCQEYSVGYFSAYRDLLAHEPQLVIHNGDYIYESPAGSVRPYPIDSEAQTLDEYRALYARYKQDTDLRAAHAALPWIVIWDDHEVVNDWGPNHFLPSRYNKPISLDAHRRRITAARQAFLENMPLRASLSLHDNDMPIFYERNVIGDLIEISRLDVRSYRDVPVCNHGSEPEFRECPDAFDAGRSMLGKVQEDWLLKSFGTSGCRWNGIVQTTVMSPFDRTPGGDRKYEADGWDNYAANRSRILDHIRTNRIANAVSLGGNIHAFYAGKVTDRFASNECMNPAMVEIVTTSISAGGGGDERYNDVHGRPGENPCLDYFENRYRGYTLLDIFPDLLSAEFRIVDQTGNQNGEFSSLARLAIRAGSNTIGTV